MEDSDGLLYGLMSAWPYGLASSSRAGAAAPGMRHIGGAFMFLYRFTTSRHICTIHRDLPTASQKGMPEYRSTLQSTAVHFCRRQKRNKIHGKVVAKTVLVLKHVDKWFLVLLRPFSGRLAVKGGRLRWTAVGP